MEVHRQAPSPRLSFRPAPASCSPMSASAAGGPVRAREFHVVVPDLIPLSATKVQRMAAILEPFASMRSMARFGQGQIDANGKQVEAASVARYVKRVSET
jgi:hypothetical protein